MYHYYYFDTDTSLGIFYFDKHALNSVHERANLFMVSFKTNF